MEGGHAISNLNLLWPWVVRVSPADLPGFAKCVNYELRGRRGAKAGKVVASAVQATVERELDPGQIIYTSASVDFGGQRMKVNMRPQPARTLFSNPLPLSPVLVHTPCDLQEIPRGSVR
jgi:hypothetical protein